MFGHHCVSKPKLLFGEQSIRRNYINSLH